MDNEQGQVIIKAENSLAVGRRSVNRKKILFASIQAVKLVKTIRGNFIDIYSPITKVQRTGRRSFRDIRDQRVEHYPDSHFLSLIYVSLCATFIFSL